MATDMLKEIAQVLRTPRGGALATIVKTKGSTPRKAGAKMLVRPDGSAAGTICGGCIEAEVHAAALEAIRDRACRLMSFHLTAEEAGELGMKCGGTIEVFVEPLPGTEASFAP
jgi:xanthine dehydrogenase accessory factor